MKKFEQYFNENIQIGQYPYLVNNAFKAHEYDCIINVSDEFYPHVHNFNINVCPMAFWFPMNEKRRDIGLNSIFGALHILYMAELKGWHVYLHCHSGRNRSRLIKAAYHYMRTGIQWVDDFGDSSKYGNRLIRACRRGYLPPQAEMEQFLFILGEHLKENMVFDIGQLTEAVKSNCSGALDAIKESAIRNF